MAASEGPLNPFNDMEEAAIGMHEQFRIFQKAGFSEDQSLKLVILMMFEGARTLPEEGTE